MEKLFIDYPDSERLSLERLSEDKQRMIRRTHEFADSKFDEGDYASAFELYEGLVEHDVSGFSYYRLAYMYHEGMGVEKDLSKADYLFSRAWSLLASADNVANTATTANNLEDPWAQFAMGRMCEMGYHVKEDPQKAEEYYLKAAKLGHAGAQYNLGTIYLSGIGPERKGVSKEKATQYFQLATAQGHIDAQVQLGFLYYMGEGGLPGDKEKAYELFRDAAEKGNSMGQFRLGSMYYYGKGVIQDKAEALRLFKLSAEQDNPRALNELAWLYFNGEPLLVEKDVNHAVDLYRKAADKGCVEAMYSLGLILKTGEEGVATDLVEAQKLFDLAVKHGHVQAKTQLIRVSQKRMRMDSVTRESLTTSPHYG